MIIYNENYFSKEIDMFIWKIFLKPKYMFKLFFSTIHVNIPIETALWSEKCTSKTQEIMPTNNVTKFDDNPLKNIQVTERTRFILANSRAITPKHLMGSGWLSNLAEIFCQQTFSQSLMIIQWKLWKFLSGQMLWTEISLFTEWFTIIVNTFLHFIDCW